MKEKEIPQVKITTLNLEIGKRVLSLSMEEAKRLHTALSEVFKSSFFSGCSCIHCRPSTWYSYTNGSTTTTNARVNTALLDSDPDYVARLSALSAKAN